MIILAKDLNIIAIICALSLLWISCEARIRYRIRTRPECRDKGPKRMEELPPVVFTGFVEQIYPSDDDDTYSASVVVKRVLRGHPSFENNRVTVGGFGLTGLCYSNVRKRDSWLFFLNPISEGFLRLNNTLLKVTIPNLDRINAIIRDKPYRRRATITDLPCEKQYCENNGNCIEDNRSAIVSRAKCQCLEYCAHSYSPVCGSNGETFSNECLLRLNSCKRSINYFVRFPNQCETGRRTRDVQMGQTSSLTMLSLSQLF
ncbi:agrin-like [Oppia nitens]|uniref:agrin-like n=1 Tax=Oppia nitens TaxID=1686743 RepID=UPI0023D9C1FA|nr:agrin-like [Oppia nitens]